MRRSGIGPACRLSTGGSDERRAGTAQPQALTTSLQRTALSQARPACSASQIRLLWAATPSDLLRSTTPRRSTNSAAIGAVRRPATLAVAEPE
eukprot:3909617-Prymnesium_polylepis.1